MKCLLIQAPYSNRYEEAKEISTPMVPLGILYIAGSLKEIGVGVKVIDPDIQPEYTPQAVREYVEREQPDFVGVGAMTTSIYNADHYIKALEGANIPILLGGPHASALPEKTMEDFPLIDILVYGEGEQTIVDLCSYFKGEKDLKDVMGIIYRDQGKIIKTPSRPAEMDMDKLPLPAREFLPVERYLLPPYLRTSRKGMHVITSRGCPYPCTFCSVHSVTGYRVRAHSTKRVVDEFELLKERYGASFFLIYDDIFTLKRERVVEFCNEIIKRKLDIHWFCMSRVNCVDYELLSLMRKSGLYALNFGVESGNQKLLNNIRKGQKLEQVRQAFTAVRRVPGLKVFASFMFGLPEETRETVEETIRFAIELDPDQAFFFVLTPYPGTTHLEKFQGGYFEVSQDWSEYQHVLSDAPLPMKSKDFTEAELKGFLIEANRRFYGRWKYMRRQLFALKSFPELWGKMRGVAALYSQISNIRNKNAEKHKNVEVSTVN